MIQAAPFIIPIAEALGLSVATLGMAKVTDEVNKYIRENPEQAQKLIATIMPAQGIASAIKTNPPGVFAPDAEEMERERQRIEQDLKPGVTKPIDQGPIKTGETTPPKIETTETLPIEDKLLPQLPLLRTFLQEPISYHFQTKVQLHLLLHACRFLLTV